MYEIQKDIINFSKELEKLEKGKKNIQDDINYGKRLSDIQKNIAEISKTIENLEKEKLNIQIIQILQPPVTTEIAKSKTKSKQRVMLAIAVGVFLSVFLAFLVEYVSKYKHRKSR